MSYSVNDCYYSVLLRPLSAKMGVCRIAPTCMNMRRTTPPRAPPAFNTALLIEAFRLKTTPHISFPIGDSVHLDQSYAWLCGLVVQPKLH